MLVGVILAAGLAIGGAIGLWQIGEGVKKRQEAVGEGIAKAVTWMTLAAGICVALALLMFFMTRSRAAIGPGGMVATIQGGGAPQTGGPPK